MSLATLRQLFSHFTADILERQQPDGGVPGMAVAAYGIAPLGLAYTVDAAENPWRGDERVLEAILRFSDANTRSFDLEKGFQNGDHLPPAMGMGPFDDWRLIAWIEALQQLGDAISDERREAAHACWRTFCERQLSLCHDMDTFDGQIPNLGIWSHVIMHRVGQLLDEPRYTEMADLALGRVLDAQTPDGVWREAQSAGLFKGSHVTNYNLISASAINLHWGFTGCERSAAALNRAWSWYYDYLLPNGASPPNFTIRQPYHTHINQSLPAWFMNKPEGRHLAQRMFTQLLDQHQANSWSVARGIFFLAIHYPFAVEAVEPREPKWPEFKRMVAEEGGIRRRHKWHACFAGMQNAGLSSYSMRLFANERQDVLALYHEDAGLLIGSAHSKLQEEASTFAFYETGCVRYIHDEAYFKASPALDTMLLRYGSNLGAASIDTTDADRARVIFSLHGERGHSPDPGPGHTMSAMAAKAHLTLRIEPDATVTLDGKTWRIDDPDHQQLRLKVEANQVIDFGSWQMVCIDAPWEFRWPVRLAHHYKLLAPGERVAIAEVVLHRGGSAFASQYLGNGQPTAEFHVTVS